MATTTPCKDTALTRQRSDRSLVDASQEDATCSEAECWVTQVMRVVRRSRGTDRHMLACPRRVRLSKSSTRGLGPLVDFVIVDFLFLFPTPAMSSKYSLELQYSNDRSQLVIQPTEVHIRGTATRFRAIPRRDATRTRTQGTCCAGEPHCQDSTACLRSANLLLCHVPVSAHDEAVVSKLCQPRTLHSRRGAPTPPPRAPTTDHLSVKQRKPRN